jgi:precorrin-2 dehydrogenase/sirohydrochlorin ferrochelatase
MTDRFYMACLDLDGRLVTVVGGGRVALEKARGAAECGARLRVVAPELEPELRGLADEVRERRYEDGDLEGSLLALVATGDAEADRRVRDEADRSGIFCNVADVPELCSFILPAVHRADPIAVAISTGGASPALAQRLRREIEPLVTDEHARLARQLRALRPWARRNLPTYEDRRDYFERLVARALP